MPKLPAITPKRLLKVFLKLGFQVDHSTGSHFILYSETTKQRAVIPFHCKDLPKGTLLSILEQAGISKEEFLKYLKH